MSGINSSARDAAPAPEALSFTVHSMPAPDLQAQRRRQLGGRWRMLLVLLACAAPVLASYFAYYVWRPEGRTNYSDMILPTRAMPADLALRTLDGASVDAASLKGQWLLMVVGPAACDPACEQRVYLQRQLREMLGKERDRVDRIWLITDEAAPAAPLMEAAQATAGPARFHEPVRQNRVRRKRRRGAHRRQRRDPRPARRVATADRLAQLRRAGEFPPGAHLRAGHR